MPKTFKRMGVTWERLDNDHERTSWASGNAVLCNAELTVCGAGRTWLNFSNRTDWQMPFSICVVDKTHAYMVVAMMANGESNETINWRPITEIDDSPDCAFFLSKGHDAIRMSRSAVEDDQWEYIGESRLTRFQMVETFEKWAPYPAGPRRARRPQNKISRGAR